MSNVIPIADVHGSHKWESICNAPHDSDTIFVFMGDYFDSWTNRWPDQGENFMNICKWVREDTEHRKMLIGNHDWSYLSGTRDGEAVSGHQPDHVHEIRGMLTSNLDIIDLAFEIDGIVFSHAGFSKYWVTSTLFQQIHVELDEWPDDDTGKKGKVWDESEFSIDFLNKFWHKHTHNLGDETFFYGFDEILDWHGLYSGSGDEITQGPLWIRPNALLEEPYFDKQVVGHTEMSLDYYVKIKEGENYLVIVDSRDHSIFGVISTDNFTTHKANWLSLIEAKKRYTAGCMIIDMINKGKTQESIDKFAKSTHKDFYIPYLYEIAPAFKS